MIYLVIHYSTIRNSMNSGANIRFLNSLSYRVWKAGGVCTHILEGHCGAVSSVNIIKSDGMNKRLPSLKCLLFASVASFFYSRNYPIEIFSTGVTQSYAACLMHNLFWKSQRTHLQWLSMFDCVHHNEGSDIISFFLSAKIDNNWFFNIK